MRRVNQERVQILVAALIVLLTIAPPVRAQLTTGTVLGTVKDPQGGVIPGATVTLTSDTRGTTSAPVVTGANGDFTFVNVAAGHLHRAGHAWPASRPPKQIGVTVSPGDRARRSASSPSRSAALTETVTVKAEAPAVQARERRALVHDSDQLGREPADRQPQLHRARVAGARRHDAPATRPRIGGGGDTNIMMDGVGVMDTGSNRPLLQMNVESIAEVKVLTSGYQAEYGRSSGLQITAVTKSGTNRFRGSVYDVERNSDWYSNTKANKLNGNPKTVLKEKDWGYSIGGPIGKPGGNNKLFFFYSQEFSPRTGGNDVQRYRFPTALERAGDFSQTTRSERRALQLHQEPVVAERVHGGEHERLLPGRRRARPDPGDRRSTRPA